MSLQSTDPIADLLTRIRNAALVGKTEVRVPTSKLKKIVAEQLVKNHYLADVKLEDGKPRGTLVITINNNGENAAFTELASLNQAAASTFLALTFRRSSKAAASS